MKYASANMSAKYEMNYDELENSIVDSLSEISIASTLPMNVQNQNFINNTINDVISIYLWSNDFVYNKKSSNDFESALTKKTKRNKLHQDADKLDLSKIAWEYEKNHDSKNGNYITSKNSPFEDSNEIDSRNLSPKVITSKKNHTSFPFGKDETSSKQQSKVVVPALDFSYLQENNKSKMIESNGDYITKQEESNRKDKIKSKPAVYEHNNSNGITIQLSNKEPKVISLSDYSKSRNYDSVQKKTEIEIHRLIKLEIENLLKDLKLVKHQSTDINDYYDQENENKISKVESDKLNAMAVNLKELLARLLEKRRLAKRNTIAEKMNRDEIHMEKIDTQKELLAFEEKHGRPQTKLEKDLMRPLYDHYRKVKRLLGKATGKNLSNVTGSGDDDQMDDDEINNIKDHKHFINLHSLSIVELNKEKDSCLHEKTKLKDHIKKYETEFIKSTGRPLAKEDREFHKDDFERYKILKAKLKLIDALIEKQTNKT